MVIGCVQNMSRNKRGLGAHFPLWPVSGAAYSQNTMTPPLHPSLPTTTAQRRAAQQDIGYAPIQFWVAFGSSLLWAALCSLAALATPAARAQEVVAAPNPANPLQGQVQELLKHQPLPQGSDADAAMQQKAWRVEVVLGQLDPRLKLAPCDKVRAYIPDGVQMWGKTRVGLRCEQGPVRWNVFWPVTVKVWGQALVATVPLRPGNPINVADLRLAEVDLAAQTSPAMTRAAEIVGRSVVRSIEPGHSLRQDDIKSRRWFAAGDPVRLTVRGAGFQVASEGMALTPGDEGHCARIRTDNGRIVCGVPVGDRQVELSL
jgi:flagella basal body P-ring formation protein FlgA